MIKYYRRAIAGVALGALVAGALAFPGAVFAETSYTRVTSPGIQQDVVLVPDRMLNASDPSGIGDFDLFSTTMPGGSAQALVAGVGNQWQAAADGDLLVYVSQQPADPGGGTPATSSIVARYLPTGAQRVLAMGGTPSVRPTVHGGRVAWLQGSETGGSIVYCDVDVNDDGIPDFAQVGGPLAMTPVVVVPGATARSPFLGEAGLIFSRDAGTDAQVVLKADPLGVAEEVLAASTSGVKSPMPRTAGDLAVWVEKVSGVERVRVRDISTAETWFLGAAGARLPVTNGSMVAWVADYWTATPSVRTWDRASEDEREVRVAADVISELTVGGPRIAWVERVDAASGDKDVFWAPLPVTGHIDRLDGPTRYSTAVAVARAGFDIAGDASWSGVTDVVLASGENAHLVDSLSAGSLTWLYDAPLLLVSSNPASNGALKSALAEMAAANGSLTVHIVGGTASVSAQTYAEIAQAVPGLPSSPDRVFGPDRYATATAVSERVRSTASGLGKMTPESLLVAAAATEGNLFDALALSAISAKQGSPILLVRSTSIPAATLGELTHWDPETLVVAGGTVAVSAAVESAVEAATGTDALRWFGANRYATSVAIARGSITAGWLAPHTVGVAAKLPDALAGGAFVGRAGGPLVTTTSLALHPAVSEWLDDVRGDVGTCYLFGGPAGLSYQVGDEIGGILAD